ncbi:MAG: tRNA pseudouridine(38-40) synthase TruA [Gammaproteobacteria bacterium]|nr:MAG: tRNA pseudouridine(38-40) synthase TruA [Gammaproteobacteria bacterium]
MRIAGVVEYDGTAFQGWQVQEGTPTVQGAVEDAVSQVADHPVKVTAAGRTDAGVHAVAQVFHFDTDARRSARSWTLGTNVNLPADITVHGTTAVADDFHARFSALSRVYRYVILNRWVRPALQQNRVAWFPKPLDAGHMDQAAIALLGEHDFTSFRAVACQAKQPVRTVHRIAVTRRGDHVILEIEANAFLHHMVRNIVGTLLRIGTGDRPVESMREVLDARDRASAGMTAPAAGLYLVRVRYPEHFELPDGPELVY